MQPALKLTVEEMLKLPQFREAEIVAGMKGIHRVIRWTHIIEVTEIGHLLNGNELILTTGVVWRDNQRLGRSFLSQLIEKGASALCVELETYLQAIPEELIQMAEANDFPLIIFHGSVRFIDITHQINELLMESQYKMMSELETFSNQLNRLLLSGDAFKKILRLLHEYLDVQVIHIPTEGEVSFFPPIEQSRRTEWLKQIRLGVLSEKSSSQPIQALGRKFADLVMVSETEEWTDFDALVLDRTATALAQEQMRALYIEEKRKSAESLWVDKWVEGAPTKDEIEQHLQRLEPSLKPNGYTVCLGRWEFSSQQSDFTYYSLALRSVFERNGFYPLISLAPKRMIFVLVNQRKRINWKNQLRAALTEIFQIDLFLEHAADSVHFGVGNLLDNPERLYESYRMAREVIHVKEITGKSDRLFYDELYVYRLLSEMDQHKRLKQMADDYIGPVLAFDKKHKSRMFETLKVFLEVHGSKKEAADKLFIVRQTLYHRLEKLKELLGEDFMTPEKRLAIEMAVYAHEFTVARDLDR
ncbi:MAG TPA: PucR family transcriptional regulator [Bacillales bacterium]|nr:PucR family transcriptional regulator [Bacillales bacterium]